MEPKKQPVKSSTLRCGKRTFFFDVNVASNNKRYLKITESRLMGEGEKSQRNSFLLFPEDLVNFQQRLDELAGDLKTA